jgi:hypothetical protein
MAVSSVMKRIHLTITVTGVRRQRLRNWLGCQLIRLAAVVMGVGGIEIVHADNRGQKDV